MDSLGLNIVAVPPLAAPSRRQQQQQQGGGGAKRRKPKNKYEKRRRKAQLARELLREQAQESNDDKKSPRKTAKTAAHHRHQDEQEEKTESTKQETIPRGKNDATVAGARDKEDAGASLDSDHAFTNKPSNNKAMEVKDHVETIEEAFPDEYGEQDDNSDDDDDSDKGNDATKNTKHSMPILDEEERAKYLREFHARPLELDRRAGAGKKIATSRESRHLFRQDCEWTSFGCLHPRIVQTLQSQHFALQRPTTIQNAAIPAFLHNSSGGGGADQGSSSSSDGPGQNLLLHSETGSGKTLAYLLPILQFLAVNESDGASRQMNRNQYGTRCLILCPTRELAAQTFTVLERLCANTFHWLVPGSLLGEESRKSEKARIRKGLAIIVATPGRLLDHLTKTESLLLALKGKLEWLVLDEADRLLDMGLGGQVQQIVQRVRANQPGSGWRQDGVSWRCVLVSATVTSSVEKLAKETLLGGDSTWKWIKGGSDNNKGSTVPSAATTESGEESQLLADSTPRQLAQLHVTVSAKLRLAALVAILVQRVQKGERTVVFMSTCAGVDYYHALLMDMDCILDREDDGEENDGKETAGKGIFGNRCPIYKLHGNVPHGERQQVLRNFLRVSKKKPKKNGDEDTTTDSPPKKEAAILLSTDVAARGLNLQDCDWTIQFDPPSEVADYVHRAGRVARAGRAGHSVLFLLPSERLFLEILKQRGVKNMSALSLTVTLNHAARICSTLTDKGVQKSGGGLGGRISTGTTGKSTSRVGEAFVAEVQRRLEDCVALDEAKVRADRKEAKRLQRKQDKQKGRASDGSDQQQQSPAAGSGGTPLSELASKACLSHIRAYPTREKLVKHIFSARALHLGHVARSFALKEPPKKVASKTKRGGTNIAASDDHDSKKRSAALAFQDVGQDDEDGHQQHMKRSPHHNDVPNVRNARARMMEKAAKLQTQGMDSI